MIYITEMATIMGEERGRFLPNSDQGAWGPLPEIIELDMGLGEIRMLSLVAWTTGATSNTADGQTGSPFIL